MMSFQLFLIFSVRAFGDAGFCARLFRDGRASAKLRDTGRFFASMMTHNNTVATIYAMVVYGISGVYPIGNFAMVWKEFSRFAVANESVQYLSCVAQ